MSLFNAKSYAQGAVALSLSIVAEALTGALIYANGHLEPEITASIRSAQESVQDARESLSRSM